MNHPLKNHFTPFIFLAVPCGIVLAFLFVPPEELSLGPRSFLHTFAFLLCYVPYLLGSYWRLRCPRLATLAYLSANALRILGIFIVFFPFENYSSKVSLEALLEIYLISIATFLIFQFLAIFWNRQRP